MNPWWVRALLRLLPVSYRSRFGDALVSEFERLRTDALAAGGRRAMWRYVSQEARAFLHLVVELHRANVNASRPVGSLRAELSHAWRRLRQRPALSVATIALLTVALMAPMVAFAVADAVLWRPLPYRQPDSLVTVWEASSAGEPARVTGGRYVDWRTRATAFDSLAAFGAAGFQVDAGGEVTSIRGVRVTGNFFAVLGVVPAVGRLIDEGDQRPGAPPVVVLSHEFWRRHFGASTAVIGTTLQLSNTRATVIGVLPEVWLPAWPVNPATIQLTRDHRQLWVPMPPLVTLEQNTRSHLFGLIGRLAPGYSAASATDQLRSLVDPAQSDPHGGVARPLREQLVQDAQQPLVLVWAAGCCVLLVAGLNLAALELAACHRRVQEFRVRAALGAGSWTLARQLLCERAPVVGIAVVVAVASAHVVIRRVTDQLADRVPLMTTPTVDARGLALAALLAAAVIMVMVLWPVVRVRRLARLDSGASIRVTAGGGAFRALIVGQLGGAVALVLLSTTLVQTLMAITRTDPGFIAEGLHVLEFSLPRDRYRDPDAIVAFERRLQAHVAGAAGVRATTLVHDHPFAANWIDVASLVGDAADTRDTEPMQVQLRIVAPNYVDAVGARILDGRMVDASIEPGDDGQVVVNEAFLSRYRGGPGRRLVLSSPRGTWGDDVPQTFEIVGVVGDERFHGLSAPSAPAVYVTTRQFPQTDLTLLVRFDSRASLASEMRTLVREIEPRASLGRVDLLTELEAAERAPRTSVTAILAAFASGALVLAALGLSGMLLLRVSAAEREIGIRRALGAGAGAVVHVVAGAALVPVALGVLVGVLGAAGATQLFSAFVTNTYPTSLPFTGVVVAGLVGVALAALALPVWRALSVDPVRTLRQ